MSSTLPVGSMHLKRFTNFAASVLALLLLTSIAAGQVPSYSYIVELTEEPDAYRVTEASPAARAAMQRMREERVVAQQQTVRSLLTLGGAQPFGSVSTVANALFVWMPEAMANRLASAPGVRRIVRAHEVRLLLDNAVPLHRVPEAWLRIGGDDLAGAGIKIGIIDTGIDVTHPGFQDTSMQMPEGFPLVNRESDLKYTSNKVIVARSYLSVLGESDSSARDSDGHGTAVAMAAAGVIVDTANGQISGVAPKAWLGSYNIFYRSGGARSDLVLKALDDAVRDGMDVINLSLGSPFAPRPEDDIFGDAVDRAAAMGVVVVVAAGNDGPEPFTIGDTGVTRRAISVGATWNSRVLAGSVTLGNGEVFPAIPSAGESPSEPLSAPLDDITALDPSGLACDPLPAGSLSGGIAFILRGACFFEDKLKNADAAGAIGALIYTDADRPDAIPMAVGTATLPAAMVSHADGLLIKEALAQQPSLTATIDFQTSVPTDPHRLVSFSSRGPSTDLGIKPDLVAVGEALNTAALGGGFSVVGGTSFSAPLVAGAAAALMGARPGLAVDHYRSLLINAADALVLSSGEPAPVMHAGGGVLDLEGSLTSTVTAYPTALSFGAAGEVVTRQLTVFNLGDAGETLAIWAQPHGTGAAPTLSTASLAIPAREARTITVEMAGTGLAEGSHEGMIRIEGSQPGSRIHVPYWYAVRSDTAATLKIVDSAESGSTGGTVLRAISVRVTDAAGVPLDTPPTVTVVSGGGSVIRVYSDGPYYPGLWEVNVRLGPTAGENVFRVEQGELSEEVVIEGKSL